MHSSVSHTVLPHRLLTGARMNGRFTPLPFHDPTYHRATSPGGSRSPPLNVRNGSKADIELRDRLRRWQRRPDVKEGFATAS